MQKVAFGKLGLSPDDFWDMTPREFAAACDGFLEIYEEKEHNDWRRTIAAINIHLKPSKRINADKVLRKKKTPRIMSNEEARALAEKWDKYRKKHGVSES